MKLYRKTITAAGYDGYSMSNNARLAYDSGEMPLSKWSKSEILDAIEDIDDEKASWLRPVPLAVLKDKLLIRTSWHHTSKMYNRTDFYSIDEQVLDELTIDEVNRWIQMQGDTSKVTDDKTSYRGDVEYLEWTGSRKHPRPIKHKLEDVNIEERGSFYVITDDSGREILRKKIGSNGTYVYKR